MYGARSPSRPGDHAGAGGERALHEAGDPLVLARCCQGAEVRVRSGGSPMRRDGDHGGRVASTCSCAARG